MCNVRDLGPYFVFGARQHFMTAKETQQESGQRGRQRQTVREIEKGHLRPLTLPKAGKGMRKNARQRGTDGGIDKIEEIREGGRGGGWERGARGLVEVWGKAIPKLQQKCTTRAADNERRALKMQHYVYAVVHRQKSQTTAQNPGLSTVSLLSTPHLPFYPIPCILLTL